MMRTLAASLVAAFLVVGCAYNGAPKPSQVDLTPPKWTMDGVDGSRRSFIEASPSVSFELANRYVEAARPEAASRSGETAAPLVVGDAVFYGTAKGVFTAVELTTGRVIWSHPTRGRVQASPAYVGGKLIFGDDAGWVEALTLSGEKAWEFKAHTAVSAPIVVSGARVIVSSVDQNYWCLDASTGKPVWQYESEVKREGSIWRASSPAAGGGRIYFGLSEGEVLALDEDYGRTLWKVTLPEKTNFPDIAAGPAFDGDIVYAGSFDGPLAALKANTGETIWRKPFETVSGIAVGADALYFGVKGGEVVAARKSDGEKLWSVKLERGAATAPVLAGNRLYVGMSQGYFYELDAATGQVRQSFAPGSGVQARPWAGEAGVAFLSNAGVLHFFERRR